MPETTQPINGRTEFHATLRTAFAEAAAVGCAELCLCDPDFSGWPLGERSVVDSLTAWVASRRRLTLIAGDFDAIVRRHPRWVAWRRAWSHVVECRSNPEIQPAELPTILVASSLMVVQLLDRAHHRGTLSRDPIAILSGRDTIDALLQRSTEAFPSTTTGL